MNERNKMNVIAVNASPRKSWNTATLLQNALDGAASAGARTEMVHLYDYRYTGCVSCFACKRRENPSKDCAVRDELTPVLEKLLAADVILFGSPIYFGGITGMGHSLIERLVYPLSSYDSRDSLFERKVDTACFFTMNQPEANKERSKPVLEHTAGLFGRLNGSSEYHCSYNTYQFDDYAKYQNKRYDIEEKRRVREERFPRDCKNAWEVGVRLAGGE